MSFNEAEFVRQLERADLTKDGMGLLFAQFIAERHGVRDLQFVEGGGLQCVGADGEQRTFYLDNLWLLCRDDAKTRLETLTRYGSVLTSATAEELVAENIVPAIKDESFRRFVGTETMEYQHLTADLWILYTFDLAHAMQSLSTKDRERLGLSHADLLPLALENLRRILPPVEIFGEGPSYLMTAGQDYVASLLLFDDIWEQMDDQMEGDIVAAVPCRDVLLFTSSASTAGLQELRQKTTELFGTAHHAISPTVLRRSGGTWRAF